MDDVNKVLRQLNSTFRTDLAQLERTVSCVNYETQLGQAKALGFLLTNVAECPNMISAESIGWVGTLLSDTLTQLELALARERLTRESIEK